MSDPRFVLKKPKGKEKTLIYLVYNFDYKRFKYSTREKIIPKYWDQKTQKVKETGKFREYPEFNHRLKEIRTAFNNVRRRLLNDGIEINAKNMKRELDVELKRKERIQTTLLDFISALIEERKSVVRINTLKKYRTTLQHLVDYSKKRKRALNFDNITLDFYYDFMDYMLRDLNFADNTAGKYITVLKVFLNEATERGINTNLQYQSKRFKALQEEVDKIYLSLKELDEIYKLDLHNNKRLERVRDLFVFECFVGLRFSDMANLRPENIINNDRGKMIKIKTIKTGETVVIPLHYIAKEILSKYHNELPESISNQKTNEYLKEVVFLAGLTTKITISKNKGGMRVDTTLEKYKMITTHTGRRSFATNAFLAGVPVISIMKITGHKTEKSFMRYIAISQEDNANKLIDHPFFKGKAKMKVS